MPEQPSLQPPITRSVEVAAYRARSNLTMIDVFVNGTKVDAHTHIVDPGRGYPHSLAKWRSRASAIGWGAGSDAWKRAILGWYLDAENEYTVNDLATATDPQPGVHDIDLLDPAVWIGNGQLSAAETRSGMVADNTIQAGWALFAVKAFHHCLSTGEPMKGLRDPEWLVPSTVRLHEPARHAVAAFAQLTMPLAGPGQLPTMVQDLLTDLHHLADAKGICLAMPPDPDQPPVALHTLMAGLVAHLRIVSPAWAQELHGDPTGPYDPRNLVDFPEVLEAAFQRYLTEVTDSE